MVTNMYPTPERPHAGSFVKSQIDSINREGVETEVINVNENRWPFKYLIAWFRVFRKSLDRSFDLIHAHYGYSGIISMLQFRLPIVVSFCGGDVLGNPNTRGRIGFIYLLVLPLSWILSMIVPVVIVKSEEMKYRLPKKKNLFVIPNGVDFDLFKPMSRIEARKRLGMDRNVKYVLFPANPSWIRKNYQMAAEAISILRNRGWNVELVVIHSMPQDVVPLYMNGCDAMVLTSFWEGSPNVVKEAMACNLPIVSVDVGDVAAVLDGCDGCYIAKRNVRDVADKLEIVLKSSRRTNGRECIEHLEIQRIARKIIGLYKLTVSRSRRGKQR